MRVTRDVVDDPKARRGVTRMTRDDKGFKDQE